MPPLDFRTPVLVGAAAVVQREPDPALAREPAALMGDALKRAAEDAGSRQLLARADAIHVPRGTWSYPDVGRLLAERLARNGPLAVRKIKEGIVRASGETIERGLAIENEVSAAVMSSRDAREGPRAFKEKRTPRFTGE